MNSTPNTEGPTCKRHDGMSMELGEMGTAGINEDEPCTCGSKPQGGGGGGGGFGESKAYFASHKKMRKPVPMEPCQKHKNWMGQVHMCPLKTHHRIDECPLPCTCPAPVQTPGGGLTFACLCADRTNCKSVLGCPNSPIGWAGKHMTVTTPGQFGEAWDIPTLLQEARQRFATEAIEAVEAMRKHHQGLSQWNAALDAVQEAIRNKI